MDKGTLRRTLLARRRLLPPEYRTHAAKKIVNHLADDPWWSQAHCIGCYLAMPDEVPSLPILEFAFASGKTVVVPVISSDLQTMHFQPIDDLENLSPGPYQILQPSWGSPFLNWQPSDLMLIPGVGFDLAGNRLGMGKGFYDRYLKHCKARRVGIAFEAQIIDAIPILETDIPMEKIFTEERAILPF